MSDKTPDAPLAVVVPEDLRFTYQQSALNVSVAATVQHMTPEHARAIVAVEEAKKEAAIANAMADAAVAKSTHAIPAEEETKRAKQVSYRQYAATGCAIVLALLAWAAGLRDANLVKVWIALAGLAAAERTITAVFSPKKKPPELPPAGLSGDAS